MFPDNHLRSGLEVGRRILAEYLRGVVDANEEYFSEPDVRRDAALAFEDLLRLSRGGDASYDLVLSGDLYAAWYQLRRVVHAVGVLTHPLVASGDANLDILDIGCGTGATAWAVAIIERARRLAGGPDRYVRVIGLDGSPFMTATATELWSPLAEALAVSRVDPVFATASWRNFDPRGFDDVLEDPLLVGGYVFDHSDEDSIDDLAEDMRSLVDATGVGRVVLFGSARKQRIATRLLASLTSTTRGDADWVIEDGTISRSFIPDTDLNQVRRARQDLLEAAGQSAQDSQRLVWSTDTEWTFTSARRTGQRTLPVARRPTIVLDAAQAAAAFPSEGAALIMGAAGSGKSEVLVRRIVVMTEDATRGSVRRRLYRPRRILVTAFNKYMVDHLVRRVEEELLALPDPLRARYDWCTSDCGRCRHAPKDDGAVDCTLFVGSPPTGASIRFLNWDKVFTRLLDAPPVTTPGRPAYLGAAPAEDRAALRAAGVSDDFLDAEFLRVIYGQRIRSLGEYEEVVRRGRAHDRIPRVLRASVWRAVDPSSERQGSRGFTKVRYDAWSSGATLDEQSRFDAVIVDEGQDLTEADYEILGRLVRPDGSVVVALDPAQSQQLGASFRLPGRLEVPGRESRQNWTSHELSKTHRLSISISAAIRPLAERVRDERGGMPALEPRKSSVIGARPIIVDVREKEEIAQIASILRRYEKYFRPDFGETETSSILFAGKHDWYGELDRLLADWASDGETRITRGVIDKRRSYFNGEWKGLEFDAVVWLTDALLGQPQQMVESTIEWVYTVVSRPRSLLVIGMTPETDDATKQAVGLLDRDAVHFWEEVWAASEFDDWRQMNSASDA